MIVRRASKARPVERLAKVAAILDTVKVNDVGDFLGSLANRVSAAAMDLVLRHAGAYVPELRNMNHRATARLRRFVVVDLRARSRAGPLKPDWSAVLSRATATLPRAFSVLLFLFLSHRSRGWGSD